MNTIRYDTSLSYSTTIIIIIITITTSLPYSTINHYCYSIIDVMLLLLLTITAYFGVPVLVFLKEEKVH
jgi:hypothetical protein